MSNTQTFVGKLIAAVVGIFHKAAPIVDEITNIADKFINELKVLEESQAGQFIESTIETIVPASTGLINGIKLWLPEIAGIITAGKVEEGKSDEQKLKDLVNYLSGLKTADPVLYAGALNTLNAAVQQYLATNQGVILPVPQSLAIAPVVHDPSLGTL